jgi:hypothetical protein
MPTYDLSDFSAVPYGRYEDDGKFNATKFRRIIAKKLTEAQDKTETLIVDLDSVNVGIGSSFLEESFGGLVRTGLFTCNELLGGNKPLLKIKSEQSFYISEIEEYITDAKIEVE